jgi:iron(III) transport system substrate-binding protein
MGLKNLFLVIITFILNAQTIDAREVNIYSHRQPFLINPFLEKFTEKTGINTNIIYSAQGLAQRLNSEGKNSPADVILTVDIASLIVYHNMDLFLPISSEKLKQNIPSHLRSLDNTWFGLSKRSRIIVTSKERIQSRSITNIEDLSDQKWRGKICTRPGSHDYNRALLASIIAEHGEEKAEKWASGLVANLARRPQGNDRAQVKAIFEGQCDIAIINNYYFGLLKYSDIPEERDWANSLNLVFPNQGETERGAHINISGGGVAKHAKNKSEAIALLEFLTNKESQDLYGKINFEYPVNPKVAPTIELQSWGNFKSDKISISTIARLSGVAQRIIDRVGW